MHNLKVASSVLFGGLTENYDLRDNLSDRFEELLPRSKGGARMYRRLGLGREHVVTHQKMAANHKEQPSRVGDFSAFLCMGKCKDLGSLKLLLRCAS